MILAAILAAFAAYKFGHGDIAPGIVLAVIALSSLAGALGDYVNIPTTETPGTNAWYKLGGWRPSSDFDAGGRPR